MFMAAMLVALGCGPKSAPPTTAVPSAVEDEPSASEDEGDDGGSAPEPEGPAPQRLTVSFGSECCGIDREAHDALEALLADFERAQGVTLPRQSPHWGKEGEVDECFDLSALTPSQRAAFDASVTERLGDTRLVTIVRDEDCREGR